MNYDHLTFSDTVHTPLSREVFWQVYLAGEDKTIVFLIISLICALGIATMLFNIPLFGTFILIGCSILLFIVSFPLTVGIFKKKEY